MHDFSTELISRYLDDDVSPEERGQVEELLASNAAARSLYEELQALSTDLHALPAMKSPPDLAAAVLRQIQEQQPAKQVAAATQPAPIPIATPNRTVAARRWAWNSQSWPNAAAAAMVLLAAVTYMLAGPFHGSRDSEVANLIETEDALLSREARQFDAMRDARGELGDAAGLNELHLVEGKAEREAGSSIENEPAALADQLQQIPANRNANTASAPRMADDSRDRQANKQVKQGNADFDGGDGNGSGGASFRGAAVPPPNPQIQLNTDGKRDALGGRGAPPSGGRANLAVPNNSADPNSADRGIAADESAKDKAPAEDATLGATLSVVPQDFFGNTAADDRLAIVQVTVDEAGWQNEAFRMLLEQQQIVWADTAAGRDDTIAESAEGLAADSRDSKSLEERQKERARISRSMTEDDEKSAAPKGEQTPSEDVQLVYVEAEPAQLQQVLAVLQSQPRGQLAYGGLYVPEQVPPDQMEAELLVDNNKYAQLGQQIYDYYFRDPQRGESEILNRSIATIGGGGGAGGGGAPPARGDSSQADSDDQGANRQQQSAADANNAATDAKVEKSNLGAKPDVDAVASADSQAPQGSYYQKLDPEAVNQFWSQSRGGQPDGLGPPMRSMAGQQGGGIPPSGPIRFGSGWDAEGATSPLPDPAGRGRAGEELRPASGLAFQPVIARKRVLFVLRRQVDEPPLRAPDPGQR